MWERIYRMMIKEFIQVLRDPRMRFLIFVTPVVQLIVFGFAVTTDVEHIKTAILDMDRSAESRALADQFTSSGYFDIIARPESPDALGELLDRTVVIAAIQIDRGFADDLAAGRQAEIQVLIDGTDSNTGTVAMDYAQRITSAFSRKRLDASVTQLEQAAAPSGLVELRSRAWYNPDLKSRYYNVPGVVAVILLMTSLLLTSMAIVREREIGTMEQLMVTPIRPMELILGKTLPFVMISYLDLVVVMLVAVYGFGIPIRGSGLLLLFGAGLYLMSTIGVGLFISTVSKTQQQALMASFFFFLPATLLSGFMFPIENMPELAQWITYINPLRYFLVIIRDVFLKGSGMDLLWPQFLAQGALGLLLLTGSALRFRKRID
ncbi:ABC transporter permease [Halomonas sp. PBN3]|uniref:ABC transporter permease n=1 Tax=Halomonas sp. PBN3 TaxID=1397528 RepID=UPI0004B3183F|nr:ABC transporter permease [Halomonas sp. PBN3]